MFISEPSTSQYTCFQRPGIMRARLQRVQQSDSETNFHPHVLGNGIAKVTSIICLDLHNFDVTPFPEGFE